MLRHITLFIVYWIILNSHLQLSQTMSDVVWRDWRQIKYRGPIKNKDHQSWQLIIFLMLRFNYQNNLNLLEGKSSYVIMFVFAINDFTAYFPTVLCSMFYVLRQFEGGGSVISRYVHLLRIFCQPDKIFLIPTKYFQGFIQAGGVTVAGRAKQKIINVISKGKKGKTVKNEGTNYCN